MTARCTTCGKMWNISIKKRKKHLKSYVCPKCKSKKEGKNR